MNGEGYHECCPSQVHLFTGMKKRWYVPGSHFSSLLVCQICGYHNLMDTTIWIFHQLPSNCFQNDHKQLEELNERYGFRERIVLFTCFFPLIEITPPWRHIEEAIPLLWDQTSLLRCKKRRPTVLYWTNLRSFLRKVDCRKCGRCFLERQGK